MLRFVSAICFIGCAGTAFGQLESGPPVGKPAPALPVRVVMDGKAADAMDIAKERSEQLTVYVFLPSSRFDRPAARVIKGLDTAMQKIQVQHPTAGLVLVWQADDADAAAIRVSQIQGSLQLSATWAVFTGPASGPDGWAINDKAAVTVVIANKQQVTARFGYDSVNETVLPELEKALNDSAAK